MPPALIVGAYWDIRGGQVVSMDDAYVEADKVGISTDVPGIVTDVGVTENQHLKRAPACRMPNYTVSFI
jgi:membrane fusion protein, multidrug efflux system